MSLGLLMASIGGGLFIICVVGIVIYFVVEEYGWLGGLILIALLLVLFSPVFKGIVLW